MLPLTHFANRAAVFSDYPDDLKSIMNHHACAQNQAWLSTWPLLTQTATPLYSLPNLANALGVGSLHIKDESVRSPLGSFKALGAPVALLRHILTHHPEFEPEQILLGKYKDVLKDFTVISATDGNHGKGLAAAAMSAGCACVIVLHAHVSHDREQAIAKYGAKIIRISGNYDDSVNTAKQLALDHDWQVIADTSYPNYEIIPRDVMQGYAIIAHEVMTQCDDTLPFSHIILQGGVGGLAAGVIAYWWQALGRSRPRFIVVEPRQADCLYQSALSGKPTNATGSVDSVMAGLACGETSPLAWRFLAPSVDDFVLIDDQMAVHAMTTLATAPYGDVPILAGESGVAGLALLDNLDNTLKDTLKIDSQSKILLMNTEGATAPAIYHSLTKQEPEQVLSRQQQWLQANIHSAK